MFTKVLRSREEKDGNYYNRNSLIPIRAAINRHLRSPPLSKPFSIVTDSQFKEANKTLSIFLKNLSKNGEISGKNFLVLRQDANGQKQFEINREQGTGVLTSKNHQGGLADSEDHSDGKIFAMPGSSRCPVEAIQSYLSHLNPECSSLFKKSTKPVQKF